MEQRNENGVKIRYDNQGCLFGNMHRELGPEYAMFDIDALSAEAHISLNLTRQEIGFIEYRTDFDAADVRFVALFEIKYKKPTRFVEMMACKPGTSIFAQKIMCRKLGMRYFFVIQTNGELPFHFVEILDSVIGYKHIGTLVSAEDVKDFWKNTLNL